MQPCAKSRSTAYLSSCGFTPPPPIAWRNCWKYQQAMLMSPACWRNLIKPQLNRLFEVAKSKGICLAFHSCGAIRPIIADLVEMGRMS